MTQISLSDLQDAIILNQHNQSNSSFNVYSSGSRGSRFMFGNSKSISAHIGDIAFLVNNRPLIIFEKVSDPASVIKYIKILTQQNHSLPC
jgi:hypothetical protein